MTFFPLPSASGSLRSERDPCALPVSRGTCLRQLRQGVGVYAQHFEVAFTGVLAPQLQASGWSLTCHQLIVEKILWDVSIFHVTDVAQPSHASLFVEGEHGQDACSLEHCAVYHVVSPRDDQDVSQVAHITIWQLLSVESPLLLGEQGPGFAAVQKGAHHTSLVHLYFRVLCELTVCPDSFCQP